MNKNDSRADSNPTLRLYHCISQTDLKVLKCCNK